MKKSRTMGLEEYGFLETVELSRSHAYFKIRLYDFLSQYPLLKNLNLTPTYIKINFKLKTKGCSENPDIF